MADTQVTFDDAAIYFSAEQWQNLEEFQKKIYKELIKEIYETMISLGYRIPKPEIVSRIERGEEPCSEYCKKTKLPESQPEGGTVGSKGTWSLATF
ncbi:flocculation FLO11-like [Pelobates cultripes]|uniref:Flocculation FLO11-like n=1 Tax=Pelobates cultripes TaxID=61616 RepID=A0AAD1W0A3_PELCU|nr:flocculation FLO11-like [Pelobates cultripes]